MSADSWIGVPPIAVERESSPERSQPRISAIPHVPVITGTRDRNLSIDALRGLSILLMVLAHTRDMFLRASDLTPWVLFTHWVSQFCAPVFVFLAGAGAFVYGTRHTPRQLSRFLLIRGTLLIALELSVVRLCWSPELASHQTMLEAFWALGFGMLLLAAASRLSVLTVLVLAIELSLAQTQLAPLEAASFGRFAWLFQLLHQHAALRTSAGHELIVLYPILPWFAVLLFGYAFGSWLQLSAATRRRRSLRLGLLLFAMFIVLRAFSLIGDPVPWTVHDGWQSFFSCSQYPASLCFLLMTLGPALCLLGLWEHKPKRYQHILAIYGGVPMFCYLVQLVVLRSAASILGAQYPLWATYLIWLTAIAALLPAASWFLNKKRQYPDGILRYF